MREALVRQAAPQKSWPTTEMMRTNLPQPEPSASTSSVGAKPKASLAPSTLVTATVIASSTIQAISAEQKIDFHPPCAADSAAPWVSSEMWAEASKPVIVYWVSRKPSGSTYHQNMLWLKPELFSVWVNTAEKLACLSGTKISTTTMTATPMTCHHTETPLSRATR